MAHKIYLASSWRNPNQPHVVESLREWGHEVYDFRNLEPGNTGLRSSAMDQQWEFWTPEQYRAALQHPIVEGGFHLDMTALVWCDVVVLLLPSGASAHSEAACHRGAGGPVIVHIPDSFQPELMHKMFNAITTTTRELKETLSAPLSELRRMKLSTWQEKTPGEVEAHDG